jgi:hypothetical protein
LLKKFDKTLVGALHLFNFEKESLNKML